MAELNFFNLIPEAIIMDPLSIKSEIKMENELSDQDPVDLNDESSASDITNSNGEAPKTKKIRIIDAGNLSQDTSTSSSTPNNESGRRSQDYAEYLRLTNMESSSQGESDLELILRRGGDGKIIKRSYRTNGGFLPDTVRTILVHLIIKHEMDKALSALSDDGQEKLEEFVISSSQMSNYANEIVRVFPSEKAETYFGGFKTVNGVRILANGKLWDHYNYIKSVLRDQGVLEGRKFKRKQVEKPYEMNEEARIQLDWLLMHNSPWSEVTKNWNETFEARTKGHSQLEMKQFTEYFQKFPCLRESQGMSLIQSDFDRLYKKKPFDFTETWNAIKPHLIMKLQQCKGIKTVDDKAYVHLLPSLTSEQQDGVILFLLPYLVPSGRKKRRNDDQEELRKLSPAERRETFIIYVSTEDEVDSTLKKKREFLENNGRTLHPTPVGVGTKMGVTKAYVAVDDTKYEASSLLNAIELAFKIYYAAHCDFPESCHSMWLFIQKAMFDLHYYTDRATPSLHALVGEVRRVADSKTSSK